jgi:broad specificity phosphatase PhoE
MSGLRLTTKGKAQADRLARWLAKEPITHVFSSPLERTKETATPLARQLGLVVECSAAIGEVDSGEWTGKLFRELDASDVRWRRFNRLRSLTPIPGGETAAAIQARFVGEILRLQEVFPADGIALVSHADPIKIALACFLGAPLDFYDRIEIALGSVSVVAIDYDSVKVLRLNEVPRE